MADENLTAPELPDTNGTGIVDVIVKDPIQPESVSDDQKTTPAATDDTAEAAADTPEQAEAKKQSKFQRRLERQKTARIQAETEAKLLREDRDRLLAQQSKQPQEAAEPKREDFPDYETYLRAVTKFDAEQVTDKRLKAEREATQQRDQQGKQSQASEQQAKDWESKEQPFLKATPDYVEVVQEFMAEDINTLSDAARKAIVDSDIGPQLLYHLAKNPDVAEAIADLSPRDQKTEMTKLAARLSAKRASNAPAPPNPVNGGRSAGHGYRENMSDAEYKEWRKGQGARWAR